jgi:hypothetical protein
MLIRPFKTLLKWKNQIRLFCTTLANVPSVAGFTGMSVYGLAKQSFLVV